MSPPEVLQLLVTHALRTGMFASFNILSIGLQTLLLLDELTPGTHLAFGGDKSSACKWLIYCEWNHLFLFLWLRLWDSRYCWVPDLRALLVFLPVTPAAQPWDKESLINRNWFEKRGNEKLLYKHVEQKKYMEFKALGNDPHNLFFQSREHSKILSRDTSSDSYTRKCHVNGETIWYVE